MNEFRVVEKARRVELLRRECATISRRGPPLNRGSVRHMRGDSPMTLRLLRFSSLLVSLLAGTSVAAQLPGPEGLWTGYWERDGSSLPVEMTFSHNCVGI